MRPHHSLGRIPIFMSLTRLNRALLYPKKCEEVDTTFQRPCLELIDSYGIMDSFLISYL